jgi:hypothetical protein
MLTEKQLGVRLDKSEGGVKGKRILGGAGAPLALPERLRTKTLEISRGIISRRNIVPPNIDSAPTSAMILLCEHPVSTGCESAQSTFAV